MARAGLIIAFLAGLLAAPALAAGPPARIVSLNLCADQLLLLLAEPGRIAALSHVARDLELSPQAAAAARLPAVPAQAEAVLRLKPDLVMTGAFTARPTVRLLEQLGVPIMEIGIAANMAEAKAEIRRVGKRLGREARAEEIIADLERELARAARPISAASPRAVIYQANGIAIGDGQLSSDVLAHAGLINLAPELGLPHGGHLPLERLIRARPDILILEAYRPDLPSLAQALLDHPALRAYAAETRQIQVSSALWTCPGPWLVEAVRQVAAGSGP